MTIREIWRLRGRTVEAMVLLILARLLIELLPFGYWRRWLGGRSALSSNSDGLAESLRLARHVERAGWRLHFTTKCLPRAMALGWLLQRRRIAHVISFAVRPPQYRDDEDGLHAWVAVSGKIILGKLPGPWAVVHRIET